MGQDEAIERAHGRAAQILGIEVPRAMVMADTAEALARELVILTAEGLDDQMRGGAFANTVTAALTQAHALLASEGEVDPSEVMVRAALALMHVHTQRTARFLASRGADFRAQALTLAQEAQGILKPEGKADA